MNIKYKTMLMALLVFASVMALAKGHRKEFRKAMDACITETGVTKPEKGVKPSDEDRTKIRACLDSKGISKPRHGGKFRKALKACKTEVGTDDKEKIKSCMMNKGFNKRPMRE